MMRSAIELARDWRGDKATRNLEAMLICTDGTDLLVVSGTGEVIDADDGVIAIGCGACADSKYRPSGQGHCA